MSLLRRIERRIAEAVEGSFGAIFRTSVQPVELARRLVKEMDEHQQRTVRSVYVPNRYDVFLSQADHDQFADCAAALTTELGEYLAEHARRNGYTLLTRPRVRLRVDTDLSLGSFGIAVQVEEATAGDPDPGSVAPAPHVGAATAVGAFDATMVDAPLGGETMVTGPVAAGPGRVAWDLVGAAGAFRLLGGRQTVGRGRSNGIVLHESSVSREHAELLAVEDGWVVRDLGSTNGVTVNGRPVQESALAPGDVVGFGSCELRVTSAVPEGG